MGMCHRRVIALQLTEWQCRQGGDLVLRRTMIALPFCEHRLQPHYCVSIGGVLDPRQYSAAFDGIAVADGQYPGGLGAAPPSNHDPWQSGSGRGCDA